VEETAYLIGGTAVRASTAPARFQNRSANFSSRSMVLLGSCVTDATRRHRGFLYFVRSLIRVRTLTVTSRSMVLVSSRVTDATVGTAAFFISCAR
jgi:hypothetical protein